MRDVAQKGDRTEMDRGRGKSQGETGKREEGREEMRGNVEEKEDEQKSCLFVGCGGAVLLRGALPTRTTRACKAHLTNEGRVEGRVAVEGKALGLVLASCAVEVGKHTRLLTPG